MFLTRSYADGYSAIVLKQKSDGIFVNNYFKNIAGLIAAGGEVDYDKLFLNIHQDALTGYGGLLKI